MDLPDPKVLHGSLHSWMDAMRRSWRYFGFLVCGFSLAIVGGLYAKADLLHHVLGLPVSFTALDHWWLWVLVAIISLAVSLGAVGKVVVKASMAAVVTWKKESDAWKREADTDKKNVERLDRELAECRAQLYRLQQQQKTTDCKNGNG
jgi:hypothetical protein